MRIDDQQIIARSGGCPDIQVRFDSLRALATHLGCRLLEDIRVFLLRNTLAELNELSICIAEFLVRPRHCALSDAYMSGPHLRA